MGNLVSGILCTADRPAFLRQALRCFQRQTYEPRELIVIDDGRAPVAGLCARRPGVRYLRLATRCSLGTKLNVGIAESRGSIIQKLDDDDYYHPGFLDTAAGRLPADLQALVAWDCFLVLLRGEPVLRFSGRGWVAGGTLCFHRQLWEKVRFRDLGGTCDYWFLKDAEPRVVKIDSAEMYIHVRHDQNSWNRLAGDDVDEHFRRQPICAQGLAELVDLRDLSFYRELTAGQVPPHPRKP